MKLYPRHALKHLHDQVRWGTRTVGAIAQLSRLLFRQLDEVTNRFHRQRWIDYERLFQINEASNRAEIVVRIVWKLLVEGTIIRTGLVGYVRDWALNGLVGAK
jgi:hypothetical protein